jgi:hypothetical protein
VMFEYMSETSAWTEFRVLRNGHWVPFVIASLASNYRTEGGND